MHIVTGMDDIYEYIGNTKGVKREEINKIKKYIELEKFDTDSLFSDFDNHNESNIFATNKFNRP